MKRLWFILLILSSFQLMAQEDCEPYGKYIFDLIINNNQDLKKEFVDLLDYQSYVDHLPVDSTKKDVMMEHAIDNYIVLKKSYLKEAKRILGVYQNIADKGAELSYQFCSFKANPKYPGIGFIQLNYLAQFGDDVIDDSVSFECIYTSKGWKIIDGFYQENP
ncbi:MAG: hypothetical protein N4A46_12710 [Schleiferiaceae bacterium]|jgi:hypothetical protein|nr:hypothetical protein [Schleiferiaceae bacterium]